MLGHVLAVLTLCLLFSGSGWVFWRRSNGVDLLTSTRARHRAFALFGFGAGSVIAATGLGVADALVVVLAIGWAVPFVSMVVWCVAADASEAREARRRNKALGWPIGKPPGSPLVGLLAVWVWSMVFHRLLGAGLGPGSWLDQLASPVGIPLDTAAGVVLAVAALGIVLGMLWTGWTAVRRMAWWVRAGSARGPVGGDDTDRHTNR